MAPKNSPTKVSGKASKKGSGKGKATNKGSGKAPGPGPVTCVKKLFRSPHLNLFMQEAQLANAKVFVMVCHNSGGPPATNSHNFSLQDVKESLDSLGSRHPSMDHYSFSEKSSELPPMPMSFDLLG